MTNCPKCNGSLIDMGCYVLCDTCDWSNVDEYFRDFPDEDLNNVAALVGVSRETLDFILGEVTDMKKEQA